MKAVSNKPGSPPPVLPSYISTPYIPTSDIPRLDESIEALDIAGGFAGFAPARAIFFSVSDTLAMIKDEIIDQRDYVGIDQGDYAGLCMACTNVCTTLDRRFETEMWENISSFMCEAIEQLTTIVGGIRENIIKRGEREYTEEDKERVAAWRSDLARIFHVVRTKPAINTRVAEIHRDVVKTRAAVSEIDRIIAEGQQERTQTSMPGESPPQSLALQHSKRNGRKKGLCIGINYRGERAELKGCINDVRNIKRFLCTAYRYREEDIVVLTDDARNPRQIPTTRNIIDAMHWLVRDAKPDDSYFFHFSGHGGQTKDPDGDEEDGYDEVIYPVDYKTSGHIVGDQMHEIMVKSLPPGCRLTAVFDCRHSSSSLDLPYMYTTEGRIKDSKLAAEIGQGLMGLTSSYAKKDVEGLLEDGLGILRAASGGNQKAGEYAKKTKTSPADVISWSGCGDSQTSTDTMKDGQATGAMIHAFITVLSQNKNLSYQQLLVGIRTILKPRYSQKPQLTSSHPIDTNRYFIC